MQIAPVNITVDAGWNWTDVASLALTAALVLVAVIEILRARAGEAAQRRSVDQRISALAYALERRLSSWVVKSPFFTAQILKPTPERVLPWVGQTQAQFPAAEDLITQMVSLAPNASRNIAAGARAVYVKFYRATGVINMAREYWETATDPAKEEAGLGWEELRDCLDAVRGVIDGDLVLESNRQFEEIRRRLRSRRTGQG